MPLASHKKITGALLFQWFKFLGNKVLHQERQLSFWQADSAQAFRHLKKECQKRPILQAFDWKRISTLSDLQRLATVGPSISGQTIFRNRNLAFGRIYSHLANTLSWNFFKNHWLILSSIYDSSISWSEIPRWLKPFCKSNAESHDHHWSGLYLDCKNLKEANIRELLKRRASNLHQNPALIILEVDSENIRDTTAISSGIPNGFIVVPFWVEKHQPLAIWDLDFHCFRWLALGQSILATIKETENPESARKPNTIAKNAKTRTIISNANIGISCERDIPIRQVSKAPLLFSIHQEKEPAPAAKSINNDGLNHPIPYRPQMSET
ncbi:MAG: hypothetical protein RL595_3408 [Planctomycetota bacterium]